MNYCKVILGGRLTRDPETRFLQDGMAVVNFGMAYDSGFKDKKRPVFVDVTMFGKRAEAFVKFHSKGDGAFLEGELRLDQWEDKQTGGKRSKLYVVANEWQFVGGRKEQPQEGSFEHTAEAVAGAGTSPGSDDDEIPF